MRRGICLIAGSSRVAYGQIVALVVIVLSAVSSHAAVTMPGIFGDNMVLQRQNTVPVWGKALKNEQVIVKFAGQEKSVVADADGKWMVRLDPLEAEAKGREMTVTGKNVLTFKDVLVGDVWVCAGQSNMAWGVHGAFNAKNEIKAADYPSIRMICLPLTLAVAPSADIQGKWQICSPKTVGPFSAVAYYFSRKLYRDLNVPIGLIDAAWGGTRIEPWICPEGLRGVPELKVFSERVDAWDPSTPIGRATYEKYIADVRKWADIAEVMLRDDARRVPRVLPTPAPIPAVSAWTVVYNGMIAPCIPYAIRGAIWYQGESSFSDGERYFPKLKALIEGWRQKWGQGDFPFYFVQLPNYMPDNASPTGGEDYANLREAQKRALEIPNTGMAVTIDIGETANVHPLNKQDVGDRLARWALAKTYGKSVVPSGPLYKSAKIENGKIRICFDYVGSGLMVGEKVGCEPTREIKNGKLKRFALAGADNRWVWADAVIDGDTVVVWSDKVSAPVSVRYAFSTNPLGANLYNKEGLPASPFQTGKLNLR